MLARRDYRPCQHDR